MIDYPLPLIGISAYSGTGKTTLLTRLLPLLSEQGVRVAVIKHAHHLFDIDHPGKDSHELRKAGAAQMVIASHRRMALVKEYEADHPEPTLEEALQAIDPEHLDLVLVEGFKRADFPKIELHRPALGKPLLCLNDPNIIAIASDAEVPDAPASLPRLDLNQPSQIADFIRQQMAKFPTRTLHDPSHPERHRQLC